MEKRPEEALEGSEVAIEPHQLTSADIEQLAEFFALLARFDYEDKQNRE